MCVSTHISVTLLFGSEYQNASLCVNISIPFGYFGFHISLAFLIFGHPLE